VRDIFTAVAGAETSDELYAQNLKTISEHLTIKHGFALSSDDLRGVDYVYHAFHTFGPHIQYSSSGSFGGPFQPSYAELMGATDEAGVLRSYLASEDNFKILKDLESKNLVVPLVGNFAGARAIRAVGEYVREHGSTVSAFYLSNVEQYLRMDAIWSNFCANVASLPLEETSTFIRSVRRPDSTNLGLASELGDMVVETQNCR
jgi:hypothetical protein